MPDTPHTTTPADCTVFVEPQQGASYDDLLAVARRAEQLGIGAFFRSDHYVKMGDVDGLPGPTDAWITLAGLARDTERIRLGTLVTSATFRHPGPLAISIAQVDQMSGGRVEVGLGAGWFEEEHSAYGIPFPDLGERFDRLEEQYAIITGLWSTAEGDTFSFDGNHYTVIDSPALPKPVGEIPLVVGGRGAKRTPALAAQYAQEFNMPFVDQAFFVEQRDRVRAACEAVGRDPDSMAFSAALVVCVGGDDAEVDRRAAAIGRDAPELRENGLAGTVDEVHDRIASWRELGVDRFHFQVLDLADLDHLDTVVAALG